MGNIIDFELHRIKNKRKIKNAGTQRPETDADIIFFTGVRYDISKAISGGPPIKTKITVRDA